jgi:mannosyltransferase
LHSTGGGRTLGNRRYSRGLAAPLRLLLIPVVVVGVVLRFVLLGKQSLWVDEMLTLMNSYLGAEMPVGAIFSNIQGPAVSLLMHHWAALGTSETVLRMPFALAGSLTLVCLVLLARLVLDEWSTFQTAVFAALSPMLIWYSQEIRGYAFVLLFVVLMTYFFVKWLRRPRGRHLILYGVFLFGALVSNLSAAFVACAHFLYMLSVPSRRRLLGRWVVVVFVVLMLFSPWVREIIVRSYPEGMTAGGAAQPLQGGGPVSALAVPYVFFTYSVGYSLGPSTRELQTSQPAALRSNIHWILLASLVFAIPFVVGMRRFLQADPDLALMLLLWLFVPVLIVTVLALANIKVFTPRYALVSLPAYALIVGRGLAAIPGRRYLGLMAIFLTVLAFSLVNYFNSPAYGKDDFRSAAAAIRDGYSEGDVVVAVYTAEPLVHYLGGLTEVEVFRARDLASRETMEAKCSDLAGGARLVWLSLCRDWFVDPKGVIHNWYDSHMDLVRSQRYPGVRLLLYQERGEAE